MSNRTIALVTVVVDRYDTAIRFYRDILGFELLADEPLGGGKRWVVVAPEGARGANLLLAEADGAEQESHIGNQTGGRVFLFLHTENFAADYARYRNSGVRFLEKPRTEPYGTVAVFEDLYGNRWDLLQPAS